VKDITKLIDALRPFVFAAAVGYSVAEVVDKAKPDQLTERPLICFGSYAGQYAAESRVSWAAWKRLLDEAYNFGLLDPDDLPTPPSS
jgi:hypothetical protein